MVGLVIKSLPDDLHRKLKVQAKQNHRSMTKEAIALLEQGLNQSLRVREIPLPYRGRFELTREFIDSARREGRR